MPLLFRVAGGIGNFGHLRCSRQFLVRPRDNDGYYNTDNGKRPEPPGRLGPHPSPTRKVIVRNAPRLGRHGSAGLNRNRPIASYSL